MRKLEKNKVLAVVLIVLTGNAIISGGEFQYFLLFAALTTIGFSFVHLRINKKNIAHMFFSSAKTGTVGEMLCIQYKLSNNGILPIVNTVITTFLSKSLGESIYPAEKIFFKPYQFINLKHQIQLKHRGYYRVGKVQVEIKDPLNIFSKTIIFDREIDLTVFPRVYDIEKLMLPYREMYGRNNVNIKVFEDLTNIKNLRKYVPGDSFKRIDWKLTAKNRELFVKEYNLSASGKVTIYLDSYVGNYDKDILPEQDEKIVEIAASVIKFYLRNDFEVTLTYLDFDKKKNINGKNLSQFDRFLKALIGFSVNGVVGNENFILSDACKLTYGSVIFIIGPKIEYKLNKIFNQLKRKQYKIFGIFLEDTTNKYNYIEENIIDYKIIGLEENIVDKLGERI
ncbi:MAG: DUF58 domain-containing protein [Clostridiales bacterium]|nr:DUF58 domain-containing protein [Clostridiales bacterium]